MSTWELGAGSWELPERAGGRRPRYEVPAPRRLNGARHAGGAGKGGERAAGERPGVGRRRGKAGAGAGRAQTPASPEARQRRCQSCRKESRPGRAAEAQMAGQAPDRRVAWRLALGANSRAHVDNADTSSPDDAPGPLMRTPARIGRRMITTAFPAVSTAEFPNDCRAQRPRTAVGPTHTKFGPRAHAVPGGAAPGPPARSGPRPFSDGPGTVALTCGIAPGASPMHFRSAPAIATTARNSFGACCRRPPKGDLSDSHARFAPCVGRVVRAPSVLTPRSRRRFRRGRRSPRDSWCRAEGRVRPRLRR